ncbi:MAG: hypothetical protein P9L91_04105 [Candidatus Zophobacter franzmannii]|jgi:3-phosphoshikimate 1-carboxyvinyltransferase|nr:hypothetical protein [Candidatus Zophobacter franzmannii]
MNEFIKPTLHLSGDVEVEGSKSILQRILLISLFFNDDLIVENWSQAEDVSGMAKALGHNCLENTIRLKPSKLSNSITIRESATSFRFLLTYAALQPNVVTTIEVGDNLSTRPHKILIDVLEDLGAEIEITGNRYRVTGVFPQKSSIKLQGDVSSQYISALLLCAPLFPNGLQIELTTQGVSKAYLDLTIKMMLNFGIDVHFEDQTYTAKVGSKYHNPGRYICEPDFSSIVYPLCMGLFSEDGVRIPFIGTFSSQPDFLIIPILIYARADIKLSGRELTTKLSEFKGTLINLRDTPDLLPVLAFIALFAKSISIFNGLEHLKYKESNRVENLIVNFKRLGASVSYEDGKLAVLPLIKAPESVVLDTQNDHRYAMIYYMISLLFPQVSVSETESIAKSYPNFIRDIEKLIK